MEVSDKDTEALNSDLLDRLKEIKDPITKVRFIRYVIEVLLKVENDDPHFMIIAAGINSVPEGGFLTHNWSNRDEAVRKLGEALFHMTRQERLPEKSKDMKPL